MSRLKRLPLASVSFFSKYKYWILGIVAIVLVILVIPVTYTFISTRGERYHITDSDISSIPYHKVGIIFGAGILPDGDPTPYLQYRLDAAIALYKAHRIDILLMSGDNSTVAHNEPLVMKEYAQKNGVPLANIVEDDAGFDTYDTCYRAHAIFGLSEATLISQGYHLPRAMTTCNGLGVANIGVSAVHTTRDYTFGYLIREVVSTNKMVFQLAFKPKPSILGAPLTLTSQN